MSSMYVFTPKRGVQFVMSVLLTVQNTHRRALLFIDNRQFRIGFLHKQTEAASTDINRYCHLLGLEETSSVAYNLGETQTCNYFFITFRSQRLCRNPRKRVARGGKL